jgi:hypothetical protein
LGQGKSLLIAGLHWRWKVRTGRGIAQAIMPDYLEVHFESLVSRPHEILERLSSFVGCELDYERIQRGAVGTLKSSNSSFKLLDEELAAMPIDRWKRCLTQHQIASLELCIGDLLQHLGYDLTSPSDVNSERQFRWIRTIYPAFFSGKHWLKQHTKAGQLTSVDRMRAA